VGTLGRARRAGIVPEIIGSPVQKIEKGTKKQVRQYITLICTCTWADQNNQAKIVPEKTGSPLQQK
jgi:hypothetical protein